MYRCRFEWLLTNFGSPDNEFKGTWTGMKKWCHLVCEWYVLWLIGRISHKCPREAKEVNSHRKSFYTERRTEKISVWACPLGMQLFKPLCIEICSAQLDKCNCFAQWNVRICWETEQTGAITRLKILTAFIWACCSFLANWLLHGIITAEYGLMFMRVSVHSCTRCLISNGFKCVIGTQYYPYSKCDHSSCHVVEMFICKLRNIVLKKNFHS